MGHGSRLAEFRRKKAQTLVWAFLESGAGNETRTRDFNLGKVALYQLSYSRICYFCLGLFPSV